MDMDDDFIGEPEFALSQEQQSVVNAAISQAAAIGGEFADINPLIAIMQWWQTHVPEQERAGVSPEQRLADACSRYLAAHSER